MGGGNFARLSQEFKNWQLAPVPGVLLTPMDDALKEWTAQFVGPSETPFEGGRFNLKINIPDGYPFKPPKVCFVTSIFHPNIYRNGQICLDILTTDKWTPVYTLSSVVQSIQSLLNDPNPDSPANPEAGKLYREDRSSYEARVRRDIQTYAMAQ